MDRSRGLQAVGARWNHRPNHVSLPYRNFLMGFYQRDLGGMVFAPEWVWRAVFRWSKAEVVKNGSFAPEGPCMKLHESQSKEVINFNKFCHGLYLGIEPSHIQMEPCSWWPPYQFDRVLLIVPCGKTAAAAALINHDRWQRLSMASSPACNCLPFQAQSFASSNPFSPAFNSSRFTYPCVSWCFGFVSRKDWNN